MGRLETNESGYLVIIKGSGIDDIAGVKSRVGWMDRHELFDVLYQLVGGKQSLALRYEGVVHVM